MSKGSLKPSDPSRPLPKSEGHRTAVRGYSPTFPTSRGRMGGNQWGLPFGGAKVVHGERKGKEKAQENTIVATHSYLVYLYLGFLK